MTTDIKVQEYTDRFPERLMTVEKFWNALVKNYDSLKAMMTQRDTEGADAEDALQDLAVWGGGLDWAEWSRRQITNAIEKGKEPNTQFGFRDLKLTLGWLYRNKIRDNKEDAVGDGGQDEKEPDALDGYLTFNMDDFTEGDSATRMVDELMTTADVDTSEETNDLQPTEVYLSALTDKQRACIELRYKGYIQAEIADMLQCGRSSVTEALQRAYERLLEFPELRRAARQLNPVDVVLLEDGEATWNFIGFPHDKFEKPFETACCFTEPDDDTEHARHSRKWDALLSADRICKRDIAEANFNPRIHATELVTNHITRPAPIAQVEKTRDFYWSNASRLFNILGLGRTISEMTINNIKKLS